MAKTEGSSKSAKRKIEEVEEDADEGKQNSIKRFFRAPKEGKRRLTCFVLVFFSFLSILPVKRLIAWQVESFMGFVIVIQWLNKTLPILPIA